jgi:beta-glucanase (GH16 family)
MKTGRLILLWILSGLLISACGSNPQANTSTAADISEAASSPEGWELVWADEFDSETLNKVNWIIETGGGGWGNSEWQFYTDRPENLRLEDGLLIIEAREEDYLGNDYTSARIKTQSLQTWTYGRIEARIKLPSGQGIWPAFWMLGDDFPTAGWPNCGEIDIMENIGDPQTTYGTIHGPGYSGGNGIGTSYYSPNADLSEGFHTYAIQWSPGSISWFVDDTLFNTITDRQVPGDWVYDHPFFIILNLAVGGELPGYPDATTEFPQQLQVDYVRVYRDLDLSLEDLQGDAMAVSEITLELEEIEEAWEGTAFVKVVDSNGDPVPGVQVTAGWLGVVTGATRFSDTDQNGVAGPFLARKTSFADEVTFCVYDLQKTLYNYVEDHNLQNCVFQSP